jgi:site-specific DNA-cytosine methylase
VIYLNEHDAYAAEWSRNLMEAGEIATGVVDGRDIQEVKAADLAGYDQCHFFAGVSGWPLALRLAGWPDDRPVWTGSCPCQPYSAAGKQKGNADERNLWPDFFRLIRECRPDTIFGEQVASAIGHGWLDGIQRDLESEGYAVGHCVLGAHSVGSPHIRQRLYWMAYAGGSARQRDAGRFLEEKTRIGSTRIDDGDLFERLADGSDVVAVADHESKRPSGVAAERTEGIGEWSWAGGGCTTGWLVNAECSGLMGGSIGDRKPAHARREEESNDYGKPGQGCTVTGMPCWTRCECCDDFACNIHRMHAYDCECPDIDGWVERWGTDPYLCTVNEWLGITGITGLQGLARHGDDGHQPGWDGADAVGSVAQAGAWSDYRIIDCRDGKARRISSQRGDEPLAHGIPSKRSDPRLGYLLAELEKLGHSPKDARKILREARGNRTGRLKGYGNAIVPQVAAVFIRAVMEHCSIPDASTTAKETRILATV